MYRFRLFLVCTIVLCACVLLNGLTIYTQLPQPAYKNGRYNFICKYNTDKESLYEVKWFKDAAEELLRCHSSGKVQVLENPFNKIWAYDTQNGTCNFIISDIDKDNEGNYTCQVSVSGPKAAVLNSTKYIRVEEMPPNGATVSGGLSKILLATVVLLHWAFGGFKGGCAMPK